MTDGGGQQTAALRPIVGRDEVLRFLTAVTPPGSAVEAVVVHGAPGLQIVVDGELDAIATMLPEDGWLAGVYVVRPDKLRRAELERAVARRPVGTP